jgi:hypothetical protein
VLIGEHGLVGLVREPIGHSQIAVTDIAAHGPRTAVEIFFPGVIPDIDAFGPFDEGQFPTRLIEKVVGCTWG